MVLAAFVHGRLGKVLLRCDLWESHLSRCFSTEDGICYDLADVRKRMSELYKFFPRICIYYLSTLNAIPTPDPLYFLGPAHG